MLPDARSLSLGLTLLAAACANLPPKSYPPFCDREVRASFLVDEHGLLSFPATSRDLLVKDLTLTPAPLTEEFYGGDVGRTFRYAPGTTVQLRAVVRTYGDGSADKTLDAALRDAQSSLVMDLSRER